MAAVTLRTHRADEVRKYNAGKSSIRFPELVQLAEFSFLRSLYA